MSFLKMLEASFASVADQAISNPTGGTAAYLTANPVAAALYVSLFSVAHPFLEKLEASTVKTAPVAPVAPAA